MTMNPTHPDYVVPTGDFIKEWMEDEGINAAELARRLDVSPKHVSELLRGKAPLSHDMALRLENTTGVPARIWNLHETGYQAALARQAADAKLVTQYDRAKEFPLSYLRKHSFITAPASDKAGTVRGLLRYLLDGRFPSHLESGRCRVSPLRRRAPRPPPPGHLAPGRRTKLYSRRLPHLRS